MKGYKGKEVLITGGLGAIGSNLAIRVVENGANVTILDNKLENSGANINNIREVKDKVTLIIGDIRNEDDIRKSVKDKDIIFNCAAQISHVISMESPYLDLDINLKGNIMLLEGCRKHNDNVKIVYTGTRGQIGKLDYMPANEDHPDNPTDIYGINKLIAEHYHVIYYQYYGIRATSIRLVSTYGPRAQIDHPLHSIINWFIGMSLKNKTIPLYKPGTQKRDCTYVDDAIEALMLAGLSKKSDGQVYNLSSGNKIPLVQIVKKIIEISGKGKYEFVSWPKIREKIEVGDTLLSYNKIKKDLGWEPKTNLDEGLRKTIEFYKQRQPN